MFLLLRLCQLLEIIGNGNGEILFFNAVLKVHIVLQVWNLCGFKGLIRVAGLELSRHTRLLPMVYLFNFCNPRQYGKNCLGLRV